MSDRDVIADQRRALGHLLAEHRKAARYSQESFAPLTGYARSTVANVEVGRQSVPRDFWKRCDDALGTGTILTTAYDELETVVRGRREASARAAQVDRDARVHVQRAAIATGLDQEHATLQRRAVLVHGLTALGHPALDVDDLRHLVAALDDANRYLDGSVLGYFNHQLDLCARDDGSRGPRSTLPTVLGLLGAIERRAREVKPSTRRNLLTTAARCAEFAGWLYRDIGAPGPGEYWRDRAMEWAQAAGNGPMQGYVLLRKSQAAWDQRDAVRMLTLAQAAISGPWQLPTHIRVEAAQQRARGHAMLGDAFDLVRRHLDAAHQLATGNGSSTAALLGVQTAMCYHESGKSDRSTTMYDQHLRRRNFSFRDYGYFASQGAAALASTGQADRAAELCMEANRIAEETNSGRTKGEVRRVVRLLGPWATRPAVRELRDAVLTY